MVKSDTARKLDDIELHHILNTISMPCGSRRVLPFDELEADTDYDFYISESAVENFKKSFEEYDVNLIFKRFSEEYASQDTVGIFKFQGRVGAKFEVTVKKEEFIEALADMWELLESNPSLFRRKFWKKTTSQEEIRNNIEVLQKILI